VVPTIAAAVLLASCGSGDDSTTVSSGPDAGVATAGGHGSSGKMGQPDRGPAGAGDSRHRDDAADAGQHRSPGSKARGAAPPEDSAGPAREAKIERKLKESCPPDVDAASCEAMVEGFLATQGKSSSHPVEKPGDCTRSMSREECEATLRAQKESEGNYSVDVEECLADPTPRCEEVLRPLFEQQRAAESSGG
jgi:hypothetical protein